ncbi:MAG: MFS transporter [Pseudomonadota bacterium]
MHNRWAILAVLFVARFAMAFQFQSIGALSPVLTTQSGLDLSDVGLLVGLYLAPGVLVALPGGALAGRWGEFRVVAGAMALMLFGAALVILNTSYPVMVLGRLVAGAGGVVLNVVMTKMLVDWFQGREISTALAIFINSWPVGIAAALLLLPWAAQMGLSAPWWIVAGVILVGLLLFVAGYRPAPDAAPSRMRRTGRLPWPGVILAGLVWALYNAALAMVFSFGPAVLTASGWTVVAAGTVTSAFMVVLSLALPLGGIIADRTGRGDLLIAISLVGFLGLLGIPLLSPIWVAALFCAVGAVFALAGGPIIALPSEVLPPDQRTFGMGVYFTIYYAVMMIAPRMAGGVADSSGQAMVALVIGAGFAMAALASLLLFRLQVSRGL